MTVRFLIEGERSNCTEAARWIKELAQLDRLDTFTDFTRRDKLAQRQGHKLKKKDNMMYCNNAYEIVHKFYVWKGALFFTPNLKVHRSPLSLRFSIIIFKTIYFHLKVGMRFKAFHNESNTKSCVVEIH